ncbi:excalibur calcium-binding domain-containing protein [Bifidobacterium longum]|uniref:excalibur calcium-binding domain-containing protein n=1 Tax=Bifidobacterium longum TaxID=216816 RepID=UPI00351D7FF9
MLNNRVRFGNMKRVNRAVWALTVILMMVLGLVLAGCSGSSDGADGKEESTYSKIVAIAKKGRSLADVKDELKDAGFSSSDYEVKSDTDKMVLRASNWVVQSVEDGDKPVINVRKASDIAQEEEAKKVAEEKKAAEEAAAKKVAEEKKAAEEAAAKKAAEEEAARKAAEEQAAAQAEAQRQAEEAARQAQQQQQAQQNVHYANCSEVRAAGAAPLYQGQPGYNGKLDRDHDGVACE